MQEIEPEYALNVLSTSSSRSAGEEKMRSSY